jgi:hypothetical protein
MGLPADPQGPLKLRLITHGNAMVGGPAGAARQRFPLAAAGNPCAATPGAGSVRITPGMGG